MGIMEKKMETTMVCWVFRGVAAACVNQAIGLACRAARCPVRNLVICGFGKGAKRHHGCELYSYIKTEHPGT